MQRGKDMRMPDKFLELQIHAYYKSSRTRGWRSQRAALHRVRRAWLVGSQPGDDGTGSIKETLMHEEGGRKAGAFTNIKEVKKAQSHQSFHK